MPTQPMTYTEIADDLDMRIIGGEYKPGQKLPSYAELAALYSVSVSTASRAVSILRDRRVVVGAPGRGVFVARRP